MTTTRALTAVALAAALAGCNAHGGAPGARLALTGRRYCVPFKNANSSNTAPGGLNTSASDPAAAFEDCVHRWGYALAPAADPADLVAQAALDACGSALSAWNQQTLGQAPQGASSGQSGAASQRNNLIAQRMRMAEARALFYVVQARAAGCAPPPANTLSTAPPA